MALIDDIKYGIQQQKQRQQQAPAQEELQQVARTAATGKVREGTGGVAQTSQIGRQMAQKAGQQQVEQVEQAGQMQRAQQQQAADIQTQQFDQASQRLQSEKTMALAGLQARERAKVQEMQNTFTRAAEQNQHDVNMAIRKIEQQTKGFTEDADIEEQLMLLSNQVSMTNLASQKKTALIHQAGVRDRLQDRNQFELRMKQESLGEMYEQVISKNAHLDDMMRQGISFEEAIQDLDEEEQKDIADRLVEQAVIQGTIGLVVGGAKAYATGGFG